MSKNSEDIVCLDCLNDSFKLVEITEDQDDYCIMCDRDLKRDNNAYRNPINKGITQLAHVSCYEKFIKGINEVKTKYRAIRIADKI